MAPRRDDGWFRDRPLRWVYHLLEDRWHRAGKNDQNKWETLCDRELGDIAESGEPGSGARKCAECMDREGVTTL